MVNGKEEKTMLKKFVIDILMINCFIFGGILLSQAHIGWSFLFCIVGAIIIGVNHSRKEQ